MTISAIAYSYWRRIKAGARTFESVHANVKDDVKLLAKQDVVDGTITPEYYEEIFGEAYTDTVGAGSL